MERGRGAKRGGRGRGRGGTPGNRDTNNSKKTSEEPSISLATNKRKRIRTRVPQENVETGGLSPSVTEKQVNHQGVAQVAPLKTSTSEMDQGPTKASKVAENDVSLDSSVLTLTTAAAPQNNLQKTDNVVSNIDKIQIQDTIHKWNEEFLADYQSLKSEFQSELSKDKAETVSLDNIQLYLEQTRSWLLSFQKA